MPAEDKPMLWADANEKTSWADQVEEEETEGLVELGPSTEKIVGNIKTVVDYKLNKDGKKVKVVRKYKIEVKKTSKSIARRKLLQKFGESKNDASGPNRATTMVSEDVQMQFITSKEDELMQEQEDPSLSKFKHQLQYYMFFKNFKGTAKDRSATGDDDNKPDTADDTSSPATAPAAPGKYVPPSMRSGANTAGSSMPSARGNRDEQATIRVTNLSEETKESDLQELFKPFGPIQRIYLAKDKHTQQSKGFAFINFYNRDDAAKAIKSVCGFGYDHLILNVEWAKPSTTN